MLAFALGVMMLTPRELYRMSWREYQLAARGFLNDAHQKDKTEWERSRMMWYYTISPYAKKGKLRKPQDLVRFDWEKTPKIKNPVNREYFDWLSKKWGKEIN